MVGWEAMPRIIGRVMDCLRRVIVPALRHSREMGSTSMRSGTRIDYRCDALPAFIATFAKLFSSMGRFLQTG